MTTTPVRAAIIADGGSTGPAESSPKYQILMLLGEESLKLL